MVEDANKEVQKVSDNDDKTDKGEEEKEISVEVTDEGALFQDETGVSFDDVLVKLGQFGRYQKRIYFLIFLPTIFSSMHKLSWKFLGANVAHRCKIKPDFNTSEDDISFSLLPNVSRLYFPMKSDNKTFDYCRMFKEGEIGIDVPCQDGWIYDRDGWYGSSAVMDWDLVCENSFWRATSQSTFMVGVLIGSYIFGHLSDQYGRRPTFFAAVTIQVVSGLLSGAAPEYWSFVFARIVLGATTSGVFLVAYVLAMEMVGPKYRVAAGTLCHYYYTVGIVLMAPFAYVFNYNWKLLQILISVPMIAFLSYWWIVPESVRWLMNKRKYDVAKTQIAKVAKENKVDVQEEYLEQMFHTAEKQVQLEQNRVQTYTLLDLLTHRNLRNKSLLIFYSWFVNSGTYYGLSLIATDLGGNPYYNFLIAAAVEIPAYLYNLLALNNPRLGRRYNLCGLMLTAGVSLVCCIFVPEPWRGIRVTLAMIGKLAITASYGVIYVFSAELYPTVVRNIGIGASSMCARVGGIICPYINLLVEYWTPLPLVIYGTFAITGGLTGLFLPETLNKKLPETIEDGEKNEIV